MTRINLNLNLSKFYIHLKNINNIENETVKLPFYSKSIYFSSTI